MIVPMIRARSERGAVMIENVRNFDHTPGVTVILQPSASIVARATLAGCSATPIFIFA